MLTRNDFNARPEIQRLVDDILLENSRYKRELRSFDREVLVCPVTVIFDHDELDDQHCVSRNISAAGISIISSAEFSEQMTALMEVYRLKKSAPVQIVAECRWCKPFGDQYWMSGWQFVRLQYNF